MSSQGRYWLGTLYEPFNCVPTALPIELNIWKGQQETCPTTGRVHLQCIIGSKRALRRAAVQRICGTGHWELTRSGAAEAYVHKEDTSVPGTRFELGAKPVNRSSSHDWTLILSSAKSGKFDDIPADILVRYYSSLVRIRTDNLVPIAGERTCYVFWGATCTGKSRRAWEEATFAAYSKDPRTKWWDGYRGQENVVIDEFRGTIDISHILRWLDRYPVLVEAKGTSKPLAAKTFWITSNLDPRTWYSDLDEETLQALLRRLTITHFNNIMA